MVNLRPLGRLDFEFPWGYGLCLFASCVHRWRMADFQRTFGESLLSTAQALKDLSMRPQLESCQARPDALAAAAGGAASPLLPEPGPDISLGGWRHGPAR